MPPGNASNLRSKLQKPEIEPDTPTTHVVKVAKGEFNSGDTEEGKPEGKRPRESPPAGRALQCQPIGTGFCTNHPWRLYSGKSRKCGWMKWQVRATTLKTDDPDRWKMTGLGFLKLALQLTSKEPQWALDIGRRTMEFLINTSTTYGFWTPDQANSVTRVVKWGGYQGRPENGHLQSH